MSNDGIARLGALMRRGAPYLTILLVVLAGWIAWHFSGQPIAAASVTDGEPVARLLLVLFVLVPLVLTLWFLYLFSGIEVKPGRIEQIIVFCYLFTGLALGGSVLPFLAFPMAPSLQHLMAHSPVGVMPGCRVAPNAGKGKLDLEELTCGNNSEQWVINIGGVIEHDLVEDKVEVAGDGSAASSLPHRGRWKTARIRGGIVVPLYFVILSLMGAAVSMTRRVPRYQDQLLPGKPDSMTKEEARERFVFQIMQVLSAPLIAIVAYHLVDPDSAKISVVLGFASGFASETILLYISASASRLAPREPAPEAPIISLSSSMLNFGTQAAHTISMPQAIVITNIGTAQLIIQEIARSGDFAYTASGGTVLQPGASLALHVVFAPASAGSRTGSLVITDNAPGSPRTIMLSGVGA